MREWIFRTLNGVEEVAGRVYGVAYRSNDEPPMPMVVWAVTGATYTVAISGARATQATVNVIVYAESLVEAETIMAKLRVAFGRKLVAVDMEEPDAYADDAPGYFISENFTVAV